MSRAAAEATRVDRKLVANTHAIGHALLRFICSRGPVVAVPGIGVVVSEASVMRKILLDGQNFSKVGHGASSSLWTPVIGPNALINMDGPEHMALRRKLTPLFTPRFLSSLLGEILDPQLASMEARLLSGRPVDLAREIEVTSASVLCRLAGFTLDGLPEDALLNQLGNARELLSLVKLTTKTLNPKQLKVAHSKLAQLEQQIRHTYAAESTSAEATSREVGAHEAGSKGASAKTVPGLMRQEGLSQEDTVSVVSALILAGTETTISHVPRLAQLVIQSGYLASIAAAHPDERETMLDAALQEGLRVTVPSPVMLRSVLNATEIQGPTQKTGHRVKPGDRIVLATSMACARAGDFDPTRPIPVEMRQIWFGAGAHFCIGMPLAMRVTEVYLRLLAKVQAERPLEVVSAVARKRTLAAGYEEFVVVAK